MSVPHPHPLEVTPPDARPLRARPGASRFFAAYGQSAIGSGAAVVALPLLTYERTGSPWALTAILLCLLAPAALAGPVLGSVVDRFGRRRSAIAGDLVRAAAYLALWQAPSVAVMGAAAMLAGLGAALFEPATIAGLPQLAGREHEPRAQSLYAALADFGDLAGPAVAALAFAVVGPSTVMAVNAATFLVCALLLRGVPLDGPRAASASEGGVRDVLADTLAGLRVVRDAPGARMLLGAGALTVVCIGVMNVAEVFLARDVMHAGNAGLGVMVAVSGVGCLAGTMLASRWRRPHVWRRAWTAGVAAMAIELLVCALVPSYAVVLAAFAVGGLGNGLVIVNDRMLLARTVDETYHGRLFALRQAVASGAFAVSYVVAGFVVSGAGPRACLLAASVPLACVAVIVALRLRRVWPTPGPGAPATPPAAPVFVTTLGHRPEVTPMQRDTTRRPVAAIGPRVI